jgi:hypothetical protein
MLKNVTLYLDMLKFCYIFANKVKCKMNISVEELEKSLNVVGEVFSDVRDACIEGHFKIDTERLIEVEEVLRCIKLFVILKDLEKLTGRKLEVLVYYLLYGYSKDTKRKILKAIGITDSNLNNINCALRSIGVIHSVNYNQKDNEVDSELLKFKEFIVNSKGKYILIKVE